MKVKDLLERLKEAPQDDEILIANPGYFGGTMNPTTHGKPISHVYIGFDWDMGKTYLIPEEKNEKIA